MAFVDCPKCNYAFDPLELYCPRCGSESKVKEVYQGTGPVPGLPYAKKPTKLSRPEPLNRPKFQPTVKRHDYGPPKDKLPAPRGKINVDAEPSVYKKSGLGKIVALLIIIIILAAVYYLFVQ